MTITTGHLCSGYDGLGLALDEVEPHVALWHAEISEPASRILERVHPDAPNVGNLVELLLADLWRLAPFVDLMTAGFPCQPVSVAGKQLAQLDPRWLWPFIIEIIRQTLPHRLFIENVQNLVSIQKGAIWRGILADLRAAGYACRWVVMGACAVGAPHHRHRVFLVADYVGAHAPEPVRIAPKTVCGAPRSGGRFLLPTPRANDMKGAGTARVERGEEPWHDLPTAVALLPTPLARDAALRNEGSADYWAARPDKAPPLGAAVTLLPSPQARDGGARGGPSPEYAQERLDSGRRNLDDAVAALLLPTPTTSNGHGNRANGRGELLLPGAVDPARWGKYADAVALWEGITGRPAPEPIEPGRNGGPRLSAHLPEWMMGLDEGYLTKDATRPEALTLAGNGVVPRQAAAAYRMLTA